MNSKPIAAGDVKQVNWIDSLVPQQFAGALRKCWIAVGNGAYLALVGQSSQTERALAVYHLAGSPTATVQKFDTVELAREHVMRVLSENTIIPRLW